MKLKTERTAVGTFVTNYGGIASDVCMHIIDARARFHEKESTDARWSKPQRFESNAHTKLRVRFKKNLFCFSLLWTHWTTQ